MINAQHAHIYRIHTLHFIFGEIFFLKILSIQPLTLALVVVWRTRTANRPSSDARHSSLACWDMGCIVLKQN